LIWFLYNFGWLFFAGRYLYLLLWLSIWWQLFLLQGSRFFKKELFLFRRSGDCLFLDGSNDGRNRILILFYSYQIFGHILKHTGLWWLLRFNFTCARFWWFQGSPWRCSLFGNSTFFNPLSHLLLLLLKLLKPPLYILLVDSHSSF